MDDTPMYVTDPILAAAMALESLAGSVTEATGTAKSILLDAMRSVAALLAAAVPEAKPTLRDVSVSPLFPRSL